MLKRKPNAKRAIKKSVRMIGLSSETVRSSIWAERTPTTASKSSKKVNNDKPTLRNEAIKKTRSLKKSERLAVAKQAIIDSNKEALRAWVKGKAKQ